MINWLLTLTRQLLLVDDIEHDEQYDFALSDEITALLYAKNETQQPSEAMGINALLPFGLDEHELALT